MAYGKLLIGIATFGALLYFQTDPSTVVRAAIKCLFILGFVTFFIQCVWSRISILIKRWTSSQSVHTTAQENTEKEVTLKIQQDEARSKIQNEHLQKAESYKDRILKPREEAQKCRKEEEYYKFLGPAWKGPGHSLGGEILDSEGGGDNPPQNAARHRHLPEDINEEVLQAARLELQKSKRKKMELPEEPPEGATDCVLVMLRTPIGDIRQRRFTATNTVQNVLDYMTYIGFHQKKYTVATTYPRQCLSDQRDVTLKDMGFSTRITLNVEGKDFDSD